MQIYYSKHDICQTTNNLTIKYIHNYNYLNLPTYYAHKKLINQINHE
jgi:hypothetical protein